MFGIMTREQWAEAITKKCAPYSWHTESRGTGIVYAMCGNQYVGYWISNTGEGVIEEEKS